jgi:DUF1680 family protein
MRTFASLEHYLAAATEDILHLHHFTGAQVSTSLAGGILALDMVTDYPWSGTVTLRVTSAPLAGCGLAIRVPGWSSNPKFLLNDAPVAATVQHGYLVIRRRWQPGDVITCDFAAVPRLTYPSRRIDALRGTVAIERGPLVYCAEQADQPAGLDLEDLALHPGELRDREATAPGMGATVLIEAGAAALPRVTGPGLPYRSEHGGQPAGDPITVTAIPYFQWDNRDGAPMRVWMPLADTASQPPSSAQPAEQTD